MLFAARQFVRFFRLKTSGLKARIVRGREVLVTSRQVVYEGERVILA